MCETTRIISMVWLNKSLVFTFSIKVMKMIASFNHGAYLLTRASSKQLQSALSATGTKYLTLHGNRSICLSQTLQTKKSYSLSFWICMQYTAQHVTPHMTVKHKIKIVWPSFQPCETKRVQSDKPIKHSSTCSSCSNVSFLKVLYKYLWYCTPSL